MNEQGFVIFYDGHVADRDLHKDKTRVCSSLKLVDMVKHSMDGPGLGSPHVTRSLRFLE